MRKYIKTQTTGEQQKKHKNITGNIKHWYPAVTAACLCIILLARSQWDHKKKREQISRHMVRSHRRRTRLLIQPITTYISSFPNFGQGEYVQGEVQEYAIGTLDTADMARTTAGNEESSDAVRGETKKKAVIRQSMELLIHRKKKCG